MSQNANSYEWENGWTVKDLIARLELFNEDVPVYFEHPGTMETEKTRVDGVVMEDGKAVIW